jgi:hypothetical protein
LYNSLHILKTSDGSVYLKGVNFRYGNYLSKDIIFKIAKTDDILEKFYTVSFFLCFIAVIVLCLYSQNPKIVLSYYKLIRNVILRAV